jgi:hypothetical protein
LPRVTPAKIQPQRWLVATGWATSGGLSAIGVLTASTYGFPILLVGLGVAVLVARMRGASSGTPAALVGAGVGFLVLALVDRHQSACNDDVEGTLIACTDGASPSPTLVALGISFIAGGVIALVVLSSRRGEKPSGPRTRHLDS